ncbi:SRPBCC family protein [Undibacterium arcticum]
MPDSKFLVTSVKVQINAPASLVWDVLVDLDNYPQWNPYTVKVESTLEMGEPVNLFFCLTRPGLES